jgi:hypothetical protein
MGNFILSEGRIEYWRNIQMWDEVTRKWRFITCTSHQTHLRWLYQEELGRASSMLRTNAYKVLVRKPHDRSRHTRENKHRDISWLMKFGIQIFQCSICDFDPLSDLIPLMHIQICLSVDCLTMLSVTQTK